MDRACDCLVAQRAAHMQSMRELTVVSGRDEPRSYAFPTTSRIQAFTNASSFHESYRPLGPP